MIFHLGDGKKIRKHAHLFTQYTFIEYLNVPGPMLNINNNSCFPVEANNLMKQET